MTPALHVVREGVDGHALSGPQPLPRLWELFFTSGAFASYRGSTRANFKRTSALCAALGLPDFPEAGDVSVWLGRLQALPGRRARCMSPTTVTLHRDNLHHLFAWARASGKNWAEGNPVNKWDCPHKRVKPLRQAMRDVGETWPFVLARASGPREAAFLGVLRFLGLRRGEALGLTRESFTTQGGVTFCTVRQQREASGWEVTPPKTPKACRTLPCRAELVRLLKPVLAMGNPEVAVGQGGGGRRTVPFLFPFRPADLEALMASVRGVAPLDFPSFDAWHVFRHTCAVELERAGMDVREISEWLGHVDLGQTEVYLRALCGTRIDASTLSRYFAHENVSQKLSQTVPKGDPPGRKVKRAEVVAATPARPSHPRKSKRSVAVQPTRNSEV